MCVRLTKLFCLFQKNVYNLLIITVTGVRPSVLSITLYWGKTSRASKLLQRTHRLQDPELGDHETQRLWLKKSKKRKKQHETNTDLTCCFYFCCLLESDHVWNVLVLGRPMSDNMRLMRSNLHSVSADKAWHTHSLQHPTALNLWWWIWAININQSHQSHQAVLYEPFPASWSEDPPAVLFRLAVPLATDQLWSTAKSLSTVIEPSAN